MSNFIKIKATASFIIIVVDNVDPECFDFLSSEKWYMILESNKVTRWVPLPVHLTCLMLESLAQSASAGRDFA